jgi:hypothetical protein
MDSISNVEGTWFLKTDRSAYLCLMILLTSNTVEFGGAPTSRMIRLSEYAPCDASGIVSAFFFGLSVSVVYLHVCAQMFERVNVVEQLRITRFNMVVKIVAFQTQSF